MAEKKDVSYKSSKPDMWRRIKELEEQVSSTEAAEFNPVAAKKEVRKVEVKETLKSVNPDYIDKELEKAFTVTKTLAETYKSLQDGIKFKNEELSNLYSIETGLNTHKALEKSIEELNETLKTRKDEIDASLSEKRVASTKEMEKIRAEVLEKLDEKEREIARKEEQLDYDMKIKNRDLELSLEEKKRIHARDMESHQTTITKNLDARRESLQKDIVVHEENAAKFETEKEDLLGKVNSLEGRVRGMTDQNSTLKNENHQMQINLRELQTIRDTQGAEIERLRTDSDKVLAQLSEARLAQQDIAKSAIMNTESSKIVGDIQGLLSDLSAKDRVLGKGKN